MRNFLKIGDQDVSAINHQLAIHPELWNTEVFRRTYPGTPHAETDDIVLRFIGTTGQPDDAVIRWYPAAEALNAIKPVALNVMRAVNGYELGAILISRLKPGGKISPHVDSYEGEGGWREDYARAGWRYHVCLQGASAYHCGGETAIMTIGQVWWSNHLIQHSVENTGADDRVHLMLDFKIWP